MNMRAGTWALGLVGSVVAHGGIFALLLIAIRPDPISEQPLPTSEMEVQAYELDRTEAQEQQPESQKTDTNTPEGAALDAGAIPQSQARTMPALTEPLRADTTRPPLAAEIHQAADTLPQVSPAPTEVAQSMPAVATITQHTPAPVALKELDQPQPRIMAALATPAVLAQAAVPVATPIATAIRPQAALPVAQPAVATVPTAAPVPTALPQTQTQPDGLPATAPQTDAAPAGQVDARQVQPATHNAQKLKAALAFSSGDGEVDPVSIAAFQSFMQPGDVTASGDQLRDGVAGLLAQVPCSRMQVAFDPDTATLQVNGHIPEDDLRAPVLAALRAQMGANITLSDNILILPRPQCGALSGIAGVGLPQSTDQITNPLVIGEDAHARVFTFAKGDLLSLNMTAPDYDAFIYLDYFDADGTVLHLEPNEYAPLRQANAQAVQQIGAKTMLDSGLKLVIGPPYGQEIAVAFAASEPLYDGLRPIQEPAAEYLAWLTARVEAARSEHPDFKGEWVYFFVSTAEQ